MALVVVTNIENGSNRIVVTDESGVYRVPLLPLGAYRISAKAATFKILVRDGIILAAGQTATVDLVLEAGEILEVVTVLGDSSVTDAGKIDLGRVMNTREVRNLPLITRNAYNFGLLQANVTGRPSRGLSSPNINVNGYLRRVNFLLDGSTNTIYSNRARFMNISETYVSEIQLVTNGFAPEFGDTPGMIMNVVTPSGTNEFRGAVSYHFRRPSFYSRPFFYAVSEDVPDNNVGIITAVIGGPIIKNRWQFFFGYERLYRDDKATASRLITITAANRTQLIAAGLSPSIFPSAIPNLERGSFYILRTDAQLNKYNRATVRLNHASISSDNSAQGGLNTLERSVDNATVNSALALQLASYTPALINEFRFQFGRRSSGNKRNGLSGTGPSIIINNVANLGSPTSATEILPVFRITQFQDNLTLTKGSHVVKVGGGFSFHDYTEQDAVVSEYRFSSIANYIAARNGSNPRGYSRYTESFGDPQIRYKANYWNFFAQDDWKVTRRLKLNHGLRYDLYLIPKADPNSLFPLSQTFVTDKNDFSPRLGLVYALREGRRPTVVRASAGLYYEAPLLAIYRDVIRLNGNAKFFSFTFQPDAAGAPAFPNSVGTLPPGSVLPPQDIYTIARSYQTMYAIHSNIQLEQAITEDLSFAAGYVRSEGRHLNVYRNINPINPVRYLADGRPVFGDDRLDPRFGWIVIAESAGLAQYDALSLQLKQRLSRGLQFSINYTLSKGVNDAPDGDIEGIFLSDPTNRNLDKGYSSADQRHTFSMSLVFQPRFGFENKLLLRIFNNNQIGVISTANSGERFNVIADVLDLNGDGIVPGDDRPVGIKRNSGRTPPLFNVDLRYSRFLKITERLRLEVVAEFQNLFNVNSIVGFRDTSVPTDETTGELIGPLPDFRTRNQSVSQESRQFQLGLRFIF